MLLQQQHIQHEESHKKEITDQEVLVWSYTNANSEFISANNSLQIIVNSCSCSAKDIDLVKLIRSQIDLVSEQLSDKSYQSLIHCINDSNSLTCLSTNEELVNNRRIEIENLRNAQNLLRKKYRLLSLLRSELTNCRCECWDNSSTNASILSHLRKSEFNSKMWFRQIKVIETKVECNRQSLPFDVFKVMRQLLDTNQLNINSIAIPLDSNNNNHNNNDIESNGFQTNSDSDMKIENFSANDDSVNELAQNEYSFNTTDEEFTANEFQNENSFSESTKNMQILRYDSLLNSESCLTLQPINNNDLTTNGEMEGEVQTFQELHPISSNVGLNYCAHEISLIRSNPSLQYHSFDYTTNCNTTSTDNHFSDDILPSLPSLPQITAIEIDQILNN